MRRLFGNMCEQSAILFFAISVVLFVLSDCSCSENRVDALWPDAVRAAEGGDVDLLRHLLNACPQLASVSPDNDRASLLHIATEKRDSLIVSLLLKHGAMIDAKDAQERTPLFYACDGGDYELAKYLLECGASVPKTPTPNDPLVAAVLLGNTDIVKLLVDAGEAIAPQVAGRPTVHEALFSGNVEVAKILFSAQNKPDLFAAAACASLEDFKALVEKDKEGLRRKDSTGRALSHWAAVGGNLDVLAYLVDSGLGLTERANCGYTVCDCAASPAVAEFMERKGCMFGVAPNYGIRPLLFAARCGNAEMIDWLAHRGVKMNSRAQDGVFPLLAICDNGCRKGTVSCVLALLKYGANVNLQDVQGRTALHVVAEYGNETVAKLLLDHGADANLGTSSGDTPLHVAVKSYRPKQTVLSSGICVDYYGVVRLLLYAGADPHIRNKEGVSPEDLAKKYGCHAMRQLLELAWRPTDTTPRALHKADPHVPVAAPGESKL